jgi:nucleoside-diphosphate-sugar epimerase
MKILITGSTGVLGRRLVEQLVARGHTVVGVVRTLAGEQLVSSLGGVARWADVLDADSLVHAAGPADVVIHAATAIPTKVRRTARDWQVNDRLRRQGTQALADCAARIGARSFVFQSVIWVACPADGSAFDEDSPPRPDAILQSALDGERIAQESAARHGFNACVLRCGMFSRGARPGSRGLAARKLQAGGRTHAEFIPASRFLPPASSLQPPASLFQTPYLPRGANEYHPA